MINREVIRPGADLSEANLRGADLSEANLRGANLFGADLSEANLRGADLFGANLSEANLRGANLFRANLRGADLFGADLKVANLSEANLRGANLTDAKGLPPMKCPETGSYIAYKKAKILEKDVITLVIVALEIPETAKRSSATTNKCRCSEAKVLSIESLDETKMYNKATALFDHDFVYEVGKTVKVDDFDDDRWAECAPGIHHFMSREEAEKYYF